MMYNAIFVPAEGATTAVNNAVAATSAVTLPFDCNAIVLSNSSATATSFVRVTYYNDVSDIGDGDAPTTTTDIPIFPGQQILRYVQKGKHKVIRTIASAADGVIYITPGSMV